MQYFPRWLILHGKKPSTIHNYCSCMKRLLRDVHPFDSKHLTDFLFSLHEHHRRNSYLNKYIDASKSWCAYKGCTVDLPYFPDEPVLKSTMSDTEIETFLSLSCPTCRLVSHGKETMRKTDPIGWNMFTVFWTIMAYSGMRCGEVAKLTVNDVDFGQQVYILQETKTGKPRYVPILDRVVPILKEYLIDKEMQLFPCRRKQSGIIQNGDWDRNFNVRVRLMGIKRSGLTPYSLRHSFATNILPATNLFDTMELLGHSNPRTTMQYYHNNIQTLKKAIAKLPLNMKTPEDKIQVIQDFILSLNLPKDTFAMEFSNDHCEVSISKQS